MVNNKIIKIFLTILILYLSSFQIFANDREKELKSILKKSIESAVFKEHFNICVTKEILTIVDTSDSFHHFDSIYVCNRILKLSTVLPNNVSPNKKTNFSDKTVIILYNIEIKGNKYLLSFWHPSDNKNLVLKVTKSCKTSIQVIKIGVF